MTREFNKQRRDDSRPPSRRPTSNGYGDARSSRPARPRLNRETVDRAWETGANPNHADYQPRSQRDPRGQPPRNGRNEHRSSEQQTHFTPGYRRNTNEERTSSYQERGERRNTGYDRERAEHGRSFERNGERTRDDRHYNDRRGYSDGQNRANPRGQYQGHRPSSDWEQRDYGRDRNQGNQGYQGNGRSWQQGRERNFSEDRPYRPEPRSFRDDRDRDRGPRRPPRENNRPERSMPPSNGRERDRRESSLPQPHVERFEGDYERFDYNETSRRPERGDQRIPAQRGRHHHPTEQVHVTRLPDGRVLKGSRPTQRRKAQFWNEITKDTEGLVEQVHPAPHPADEAHQEVKALPLEGESNGEPSAHTGPAAQEDQAQDTDGAQQTRPASSPAQKKKSALKGRTNVMRPSQRGFKWPTT